MVRYDWTRIKGVGDSLMVRIPARLFKDPDFPFEKEEVLIIIIEGQELVIRKE